MMKKILFPTDLSEAAHHAFIYALKVADKIGAKIITLHVYQQPDIKGVNLPRTLSEIYNSINLEEFESHKDSIPVLNQIAQENGLGNVELSHMVEEGETVPVIVRTAIKESVDLIVMGTKGAGWLKEILFGTVTAKVMSKASCPVLAIPREAEFDGKIDNIAITTDYQDRDAKAIKKLKDFATPFKASIYCIHIDIGHTEDITHKMEKWTSELEDIDKISFEVINGTDLFGDINEFLESNAIDIVAMLSEKQGFWKKIFHYDKAKQMIYNSQIPVLAIPTESL